MNVSNDLARVAKIGRPPIVAACFALILAVSSAAIASIPPLLTGAIVDALVHADARVVFERLAAFLAIAIGSAVLAGANGYVMAAARETFLQNLRRALMLKVHGTELASLAKLSFGQLANRVAEDVDLFSAKFEYGILPALQAVLTVGATLVAMLLLDRRLAILSVVTASLAIVPPRLLAPVFRRLQQSISANHDSRVHIVAEALSGPGPAFFRHPRARAWILSRFEACIGEARRLKMQSAMWEGVSSVAGVAATLAGPIAILSAGSYFIVHHEMSAGLVVTFLMYHARLGSPLGALTSLPVVLAGAAVTARRLLEVVDLPDEAGGIHAIDSLDVRLCAVAIDAGDRTLFEHPLDVAIPKGTHLAITGPSGGGKSSIASLLLAHRRPDEGEVRMGDRALEHLSYDELRERVVLVAQDPLVVDGTIEENLFMLAPSSSRELPNDVARVARLDEIIEQSPLGMQRLIGSAGARLSGGERQRLCLARALLAQPDVLILDEALTGVDVNAEEAMLAGVRAMMRGRTLIVISHRLTSFSGYDRVAVLESGSLVVGTHAEVLARCRWYANVSREVLHV